MKQSNTHSLFSSLILIVAASVSCHAFADSNGWNYDPKKTDPNSEFHDRYPMPFLDDVHPGQAEAMKLTDADKNQEQSFGMSDSEEIRYLSIMSNQGAFYYKARVLKTPMGDMIVSDDYTPIQVLGINARDNAEREKYASIQAAQEFQFLGKTLAYNASYNQAAQSLKDQLHLPIIKQFDVKPFSPYSYQPVILQSHDQLILFTKMDTEVRPIVSEIQSAIQKNASIHFNVYFVGDAVTKQAVQSWARSQNILPDLVVNGSITLNFDDGRYEKIQSDKSIPVLMLVRDGQTHFVDTGRF